MHIHNRRLFFRGALFAIGAALVTACASTNVGMAGEAAALRASANQIRTQARDSFHAANAIARQNAVERALDRAEPVARGENRSRDLTLAENDFPHAVALEDMEKWDRAFAQVDAYFAALQSLVDPARSQMTGEQLTGLASQLQSAPVNASLPPGIAGALATLGEALVQAKAEREATAVLRRTDPAFAELTRAMATAIGEDDLGALRGTVAVNWTNRLSEYAADYATAPSRTARQAVITRYLQAVDARDAQLGNLARLRASLLALGEAHAAAARGSPGDAMFWMERIDGWLGDIQSRRQALAGARSN